MKYSTTGVNYNLMDVLKRMAQTEGKKTTKNLLKGFREVASSRGESAYVIKSGDSYLAFVQEGLGTKNLVADEMRKVTGKSYYNQIAQDTVAMMVNDIIVVGAQPTVILAYWAAGSPEWFKDQKRMGDLVKGWGAACTMSHAVWGGGETPTLSGIIHESTIDLAGSCFGVISNPKNLVLGDKIVAGDRIILLQSSGIHANGLSLARKIASKLKSGYKTKLSNGTMYGESLLKPTIIYSRLIADLFKNNVDIHYMANITGHGWRKLMRYNKPFTYKITQIPPVGPLFQFIMEHGPVDEKEAYGNLNMGAGFALYVPKKDVGNVLRIATKHKIKAYDAGVVEKGKKQVVIEPKNIIFSGETLRVRA